MIQMQTTLAVADNSGARRVMCIKVLGGSKKRTATVGDIIKVSVKEVIPNNGRIQKGKVFYAVVVRTRSEVHRASGSTICCDDNAVVLLNQQKEMMGTRILGPVMQELRSVNMRIISLAEEVL